jgi:predicted Zn finger-like uncharacterized protein
MSFTIPCPSCQRPLRVPEDLLGQAVKCPSCDHAFTAPDQVEAEAPQPPPPQQDDHDAEPRPASRRPRISDYDEDYDSLRPRRRPDKPTKVQAIAIMILVGGIIACNKFFFLDIWLGISTLGLCCVPGTYSLVLGIMAIIKGVQLLGDRDYLQPPPTGIGVMMIINIISLDVINLTLGILVLAFLGDPKVREYYRG